MDYMISHIPTSVAKNSESQTAVNFIRGRGRQPKSNPICRQAKMRPNVWFWAFLCGKLTKNHPIGRKNDRLSNSGSWG